MTRKRDYRAEYQRRIANAAKRGLSRSQARGHAKAGETAVGKRTVKDADKFEAALKLYRQTGNRAAAAKAVGIAPERFSRFLADAVAVFGRGKSLKISDDRPREMVVMTNGECHRIKLRDFGHASLNGDHLNAVKAFLTSNNPDLLRPFAGKSVLDTKGRAHLLETDPNTLHRIAASGEPAFPEIYRIVQ
ncbi:hypothetical protein [Sphingopyxis granuli]|uniref:Uncharacterized protein n=1 Tax=Sphingopyxis granuli TaxID=267128 RepID=A0AA86L4Y7_9SPHN|nr:hypothetical protein [Sphingopyxis granuli]AMG75460.1 Uncharacterized protein SGRAN_3114 [Sphingopyxis granuli]